MNKLKVLIEGYAREENDSEFASSSVTLIRSNDLNILVDVGTNRQLLIDQLKKENLTPGDINFIVLTHTHPDHCLLIGMFENATILDNDCIYTYDSKISEHEGKIPGTDIEIIPCPGHDEFHCAVSLDTEELGRVVVAADVFWWPDGIEQKTDHESLINLEDPYLKDETALKKSREKILKIADHVIPGHGKMFKVKK